MQETAHKNDQGGQDGQDAPHLAVVEGTRLFALTYTQLFGWVYAQPEGGVIGYSFRADDCPCLRCIIDLRLARVPLAHTLTITGRVVEITKGRVTYGEDRLSPAYGEVPAASAQVTTWLSETIAAIDHLGVTRPPDGGVTMREVPVTREQVLSILQRPEIRSLAFTDTETPA